MLASVAIFSAPLTSRYLNENASVGSYMSLLYRHTHLCYSHSVWGKTCSIDVLFLPILKRYFCILVPKQCYAEYSIGYVEKPSCVHVHVVKSMYISGISPHKGDIFRKLDSLREFFVKYWDIQERFSMFQKIQNMLLSDVADSRTC